MKNILKYYASIVNQQQYNNENIECYLDYVSYDNNLGDDVVGMIVSSTNDVESIRDFCGGYTNTTSLQLVLSSNNDNDVEQMLDIVDKIIDEFKVVEFVRLDKDIIYSTKNVQSASPGYNALGNTVYTIDFEVLHGKQNVQ